MTSVGGTPHLVPPDPVSGPNTAQAVSGLLPHHTVHHVVEAGRDVEAQVLSRAVRWHSESRVLLNGTRTVVFR